MLAALITVSTRICILHQSSPSDHPSATAVYSLSVCLPREMAHGGHMSLMTLRITHEFPSSSLHNNARSIVLQACAHIFLCKLTCLSSGVLLASSLMLARRLKRLMILRWGHLVKPWLRLSAFSRLGVTPSELAAALSVRWNTCMFHRD